MTIDRQPKRANARRTAQIESNWMGGGPPYLPTVTPAVVRNASLSVVEPPRAGPSAPEGLRSLSVDVVDNAFVRTVT